VQEDVTSSKVNFWVYSITLKTCRYFWLFSRII